MKVSSCSKAQSVATKPSQIIMTKVHSKRVEPPEVRRAQIIEAAKQCFRETGFYATTMAEIANVAGVSVGLLYRHFQSKDDVIKSIVEDDFETQAKDLKGALDAHVDDPNATVDEIVKLFARAALDNQRTSLMLEIAAETMRNPRIKALGVDEQKKLINLWQKSLTVPGVPAAEMQARLQIAAALFTGIGLQQLHPKKGNPDPTMMELIAQTARQILAPSYARKTETSSRQGSKGAARARHVQVSK
jgi:TetR/AcrR family transcriptional regulator, repressor for uid operon